MYKIAVAIIKGGTGKTATAAALAQAGAAAGKKVLAIDLDPQANLTTSLGADPTQAGAVQLLNGSAAVNIFQQTAQGISVISAHRDLANEKIRPGSARRLRSALAQLENAFDFCIIDTPPTLGDLVYNALNAADGLLIPLEADTNSLQGLYQISDIAKHIAAGSNPGLHIIGTVITRYDARPKLNRYLQEVIAERGAEVGAPMLISIRAGISIREAMAMQENLFEYAPKSKPAADYKALFEMIMKGTGTDES